MFVKVIACIFAIAVCTSAGLLKDDKVAPKAVVTIQATNQTVVPSIIWTVDAVECLKEAFSIYIDDASRGAAYIELFNAKHPGNWSVAIGYTSLITPRSTTYVECSVDTPKEKSLEKSDSKDKAVLYRIFN